MDEIQKKSSTISPLFPCRWKIVDTPGALCYRDSVPIMPKLFARPAQDHYRILLVDDNDHGLVARKVVLAELGYQVRTARNGEEALERFSEESFHLVVTDYKMPNMNGAELIRRIRREKPGMPIVLLSGQVETLGLDETSTGADVVIAKSATEVGHLTRALRSLLRQSATRKPPATQRRPAARAKRAAT